MKLFYKRNLAVGIIALVIGVFAVFGISQTLRQSTEKVTGNITAFVLNSEGKVDGAILDTGDQVSFGAETGAIVTQQLKLGDQLSVTGRAGDKSVYGREFHAETLQIGENTITVVRAKLKPHGKGKDTGDKKPKGKKPAPRDEKPEASQPNVENPIGDVRRENVPPIVQPQFAPRETMTANGTVRFVLVGKRGEAKNLILSDGTQFKLPKEVHDANLTFNEQTSVSVEGEAAKSDFGTFIKLTKLTIGDRIFSFNR